MTPGTSRPRWPTRRDYQRIALGNPASVPFGRYTRARWNRPACGRSGQGVMAENVRTSLDYVARGEVDAGFVFATDAAVMPDKVKVAIRIPSTPATYPIAVTSGTATGTGRAVRGLRALAERAGRAGALRLPKP
jgi:ABC-type molybdate transport system substrate-binding protein